MVGCVLFLPYLSADPSLYLGACILFIVGEWFYIAIYSVLLSDAWHGPGCLSLATVEACFGLVGGFGFFFGTVLFLPDDLAAPDWVLFVINAMKQSCKDSILLNLPGEMD